MPAECGEAARAAPQVVGYPESEATTLLEAAGKRVRVVVTQPPWPGEPQGARRVVRQRLLDGDLVELTVASEGHERQRRTGYV